MEGLLCLTALGDQGVLSKEARIGADLPSHSAVDVCLILAVHQNAVLSFWFQNQARTLTMRRRMTGKMGVTCTHPSLPLESATAWRS